MKCEPRIQWSVGQTLLPEHLRRLEDSIISLSAVRSAITERPNYGYAQLKFGVGLKSDGLLTIESGLVGMRSGTLLSVGGNATVNTLNLNSYGKSRLKTFLHLLAPPIPKPGTENHSHETIPLWKWRLALSLDEEMDGTLEYLPFGVFESDINGFWQINEDFLPPMLQVGPPGFLRKDLDELAQALDNYTKSLNETLADLQLSGENLIRARRALIEARHFLYCLDNMRGEAPIHPFDFAERLERFHLELASYQNEEPIQCGKHYQHLNLSECLIPPLRAVIDLLSRERERTPMAEFKLVNGVHEVEFSEACISASSWFLLIQKPTADTEINISTVKLASKSRLPIVHKYFLQGVTIRRIERPLFKHYFSPEVEIWEIQSSEEWLGALKERSLAFLHENRLEDFRFFLYWSLV